MICTKDNPWQGQEGAVAHQDAHEVREQEGDFVTMHCPNCGHTWKSELPQ